MQPEQLDSTVILQGPPDFYLYAKGTDGNTFLFLTLPNAKLDSIEASPGRHVSFSRINLS
jgi:hypothetical protein